jgi:hypothetical protein
MGILGKLAFWKKSEPDFGKDLASGFGPDTGLGGLDTGMPKHEEFGAERELGLPPARGMPDMSAYRGVGEPAERAGMEQTIGRQFNQQPPEVPTGFGQMAPAQPQQPMQQPAQSHDIEVITAKLDAIKATIDAVNQRLANLERMQHAQQEEAKKNRW